jgi:hypothetical protein
MKAMPAPTAVTISRAATARGRRQHRPDHERHHHGEEKRLGDIKHGDEADDEERDQREGDDLGAANDRRRLAAIVGHSRAVWRVGREPLARKHTHQKSPARTKLTPNDASDNARRLHGFHRGNARAKILTVPQTLHVAEPAWP